MGRSSKRANWTGMIIAMLAGVAARAQDTSGAATQPAATAPATQTAVDPVVEQILGRLEQRAVRNLYAKVAWRQDFVIDLPEDAMTKRGEIWYQAGQPVGKFRIRFTEQIRGGRRDALDEQYLFDGQWYIEVNGRTKSYEKREVRRASDRGSPYKVGEGLFPLPFGQKKAEVLREFDVQLGRPAEGDPPGADHLHLVPRPGTNTGENYKELHFWVDRAGLTAGLPSKVRVAKIDGTGKLNSTVTITFSEPRLDEADFPVETFDLRPPSGFQVVEERLEDIPPPGATAPKP